MNTPVSGTTTVGETGWTRIDKRTMQWISEPIGEGLGRHVVQLQGSGLRLGITAAWLPPDSDPANAEHVADELDEAWTSVLPLPALIVLRSALDSVITAMEAAQCTT